MNLVRMPFPPAPHRKVMFFIDGENIVFRYQSTQIKNTSKQSICSFHESDVYVWQPLKEIPDYPPYQNEVIRAYYYTSVFGDDVKISNVSNSLRNIPIFAEKPQTLYPVVLKKERKGDKAKGVDIQMTVDILSHVFQNNVDTVCLFSGDGDYQPVVREIINRGKKIYLGAFSDGLNPALKQLGDKIIDLDTIYFN
ncbi:MAG: NYN domain-containing protein [Nostoc sp.]